MFGLMVVAMVAFAGTAFAAGEGIAPEAVTGFKPEGTATDAAPVITKRMLVPEGLDIPSGLDPFIFEIAPLGVEGGKDAEEKNHVVPKTDTPTLGTRSSGTPVLGGKGTISITPSGATSASIANNKDGTNDEFRYSDNLSDPILSNTNYIHAGLYIYSVTEVIPDVSDREQGITYSEAVYKMRVYVENTASGGLAVKLVTFHLITDDAGDPDTSETKVDKVIFRNTYNASTEFEISKSVAGAYADKTKRFEYTLKLIKAPGIPLGANGEAPEYKGKIHVYNAVSGEYEPKAGTGTEFAFKADGSTETSFNLAHDEMLLIDPIDVGTKYVLTEVKNTNYTASAVVSDGGGTIGTVVTTSDANNAVIGADGTGNNYSRDQLKAPIVLTQRGATDDDINKAEWTNTYADPPTPTGIFMDNLPFIIMIVLAVTGFTGYIVMKRRSRRTE